MAEVEENVTIILLKMLLEQKLITMDIYNDAVDRVHQMKDIPPFFQYDRCL